MEQVIWQSSVFPKMIFTEEMLKSYKQAFTRIKAFKPLLLEAESYLISNPQKVPKRNWKLFVWKWMRRSNKWLGEPKQPGYTAYNRATVARSSHQSQPIALGDILAMAAGHAKRAPSPRRFLFE